MIGKKTIDLICTFSFRHPFLCILLSAVVSFPALVQLPRVHLDPDPLRLLPRNSHTALLTRQLKPRLGERSSFYIFFEGKHREQLIKAVGSTVQIISGNNKIESIEYTHPLHFYEKYRYLLVPSELLMRISDTLLHWESEINPFVTDLLEEDDAEESWGDRAKEHNIRIFLEHYGSLPQYHQNPQGTVMAMTVYPKIGLMDIPETKLLADELEFVIRKVSMETGTQGYLGGALKRWINGYDVILADVKRSGMVFITGLLLVLFLSFSSLKVIPVLIYPVALGLIWTFGLIPLLVGELNMITSFFLSISCGLGIDYSVYLVKRYQKELGCSSPSDALKRSFPVTGKSVFISALTTVSSFLLLGSSHFRGIAEFGIIGGLALLLIMTAVFLFLPSAIAIGQKLKIFPERKKISAHPRILSPPVTVLVLLVFTAGTYFGVNRIRFDENFSNLGPKILESEKIRELQNQVYPISIGEPALYIARDLPSLDGLLRRLNSEKTKNPHTTIGWMQSIRDFCPDNAETMRRKQWIDEIKEQLQGSWVERVKSEERKKWIDGIRDWMAPGHQAKIEDLPAELRKRLTANDRNHYIVAVYPDVNPLNGANALAFTKELTKLKISGEVQGPIGESPVIAELFDLIESESGKLALEAFAVILLIVMISFRSLRSAFLVLFPLCFSLGLTLGVMGLFGLKMNFFNIIVFPLLIGMGVDAGVHFFFFWQEVRYHPALSQRELFNPLTTATWSTIFGFAGLILARHPWLRSIGILSVIGLSMIWAVSLFVLPGFISLFRNRRFSRENEISSGE